MASPVAGGFAGSRGVLDPPVPMDSSVCLAWGSQKWKGELEPLPDLPQVPPEEHLVSRTEKSPARNGEAAKPPADGNGVWIQTSATEVKGSGLHYQPLESPCPPEICHAHFEPFHFYGQV